MPPPFEPAGISCPSCRRPSCRSCRRPSSPDVGLLRMAEKEHMTSVEAEKEHMTSVEADVWFCGCGFCCSVCAAVFCCCCCCCCVGHLWAFDVMLSHNFDITTIYKDGLRRCHAGPLLQWPTLPALQCDGAATGHRGQDLRRPPAEDLCHRKMCRRSLHHKSTNPFLLRSLMEEGRHHPHS